MSVYLEPHNQQWSAEFDSLKTVFETALKEFDLDILHVGSTAIPGLIAKPVLDIDIVLQEKESLKGVADHLALLGYIHKGEQGIPGRFAFRQPSAFIPKTTDTRKWKEHHLYVCFADSLALKNHLLFRDLLLSDLALVKKYAQLKEQLVAEEGMTREIYTKRKTEFIVSVLSSAGLDAKEINEIIQVNQ